MPRRVSTTCPRRWYRFLLSILNLSGKNDGKGRLRLNRRCATCCVAGKRYCGRKRFAMAPLGSGSAPWKESQNRGYGMEPLVRERESCYVHGTSRNSPRIRPKIRCCSVVSNALWLPSPLPLAVALSATRATSGHLWSPIVFRRSRLLLAPCAMH